MIHLNYSKAAVLAMFLQDIGTLDPSVEAVQEFDQELFDANENKLKTGMTKAGLNPADSELKSQILLLSRNAGGNTTQDQINDACTFYVNTRNL